jgi:hypothetical protein
VNLRQNNKKVWNKKQKSISFLLEMLFRTGGEPMKNFYGNFGGLIIIGSAPVPSPPLTLDIVCRLRILFCDNFEIKVSKFLFSFVELLIVFMIYAFSYGLLFYRKRYINVTCIEIKFLSLTKTKTQKHRSKIYLQVIYTIEFQIHKIQFKNM